VDLDALSNVTLRDSTGATHRLGDYWAEQPVIVVFLRHFGCLLCRESAALLRDRYTDEIQPLGAEVVAIGTGGRRYAEAFVEEEHVPYPVLVDDDAEAARAASITSVPFLKLLFDTRSRPGTRRARAAGHKIHRAGKRVTQLGATFVIGPGQQVRYAHVDEHSADHAPLDDVLGALRQIAA
jgi:peroxiredoxin